ncbi:hypothetical protein H0H81_004188 [Sphagnurus paluster]|uniref:Uncharacterized protein n=1 Tax=Sphagnurus paluster TaxID=117069 RepID=A0A9P7K3J5_9AGAR|nr:hypothetical protein H0H81_004188 [Sphagnurus paluster]
MIKVSITSKQGIYDLGIKVVGDSPFTMMVKLCIRLALMQSLYTDDSSFWGLVDQKLTLIRSMASGDQDKISRALSAYLECDRTKYSARSEAYTIPELGDAWQQDVDDVIDGLSSQPPASPPMSIAAST